MIIDDLSEVYTGIYQVLYLYICVNNYPLLLLPPPLLLLLLLETLCGEVGGVYYSIQISPCCSVEGQHFKIPGIIHGDDVTPALPFWRHYYLKLD